MRTGIRWIVFLLFIQTAVGQTLRSLIFANSGTNLVRFDLDPAMVQSPDVPGAPVPAGSRFSVQLYFGPAGTTDESALLSLASPPIHLVLDGRYNGGVVNVDPGLPPGDTAVFQVRSWETVYGTSYEQASANGGYLGTTPLFTRSWTGLPPGTAIPLAAPEFFVRQVPEPSSIVLGMAGALLFVRMRRRKHVAANPTGCGRWRMKKPGQDER
ncbi:MAG TPA: PEP-CTERM sorting domain-containing protein [Verrucomicrobiae bacterium]|nr:PEP-CTERM sorting domain-containing protein [Verrucomicrobiae bacterium]